MLIVVVAGQSLVGSRELRGMGERGLEQQESLKQQQIRLVLEPLCRVLFLPTRQLFLLHSRRGDPLQDPLCTRLMLPGEAPLPTGTLQCLVRAGDESPCTEEVVEAIHPVPDGLRQPGGVGVAALGLGMDGALADVDECIGQSGPAGDSGVSGASGKPQRFPGIQSPRRCSGQGLKQHRTEGEDIGALVDAPHIPQGLLRCHVAQGALDLPGLGAGRADGCRLHLHKRHRIGERGGLEARQPPVQHNDLAKGPDHDVSGLQITVEHPPGVGVGDGLTGRVHNRHQPLEHVDVRALVEVGAADDIGEGATGNDGHHDEGTPVSQRTPVVDRDDCRMGQAGADPGLGLKPLHGLGAGAPASMQDLHRDRSLEDGVEHPANLSATARSDQSEIDVAFVLNLNARPRSPR